ncbi:MAG: DUF6528 family protein [Planctomycetota bacterium]|nr:DUF6528 family protein [Planctomycetota bacterium]
MPLTKALWICGDTKVECYEVASIETLEPPIWAWDSASAIGLPEVQRTWFRAMDEVKPVQVQGEAAVLVTSSDTGGAALIRQRDKRVLFTTSIRNAHSAELLPKGYLTIAASTGSDSLTLFGPDYGLGTSVPLRIEGLPHGHGVVFDQNHNLLWVCGMNVVRSYVVRISESQFKWEQESELTLPEPGAHDLQPDPVEGGFIVSTHHHVWRIDSRDGFLSPFKPLHELAKVKSVSIDAESRAIAYTQGERGHWWSENVYVIIPDGQRLKWTLSGRHLYKVRWNNVLK